MSYTSYYETCDDGLATLQRSLVDLEDATTNQRGYSADLIPGLLQTPAYARAVISACVSALEVPDDTEDTVTARLHRQALLDAPDHRFRLLFSEAALLRTVGSPLVMASQIRFLREILAARTNVEIGIIPITATFVTPATLFVINDLVSVDIETVTGAVTATSVEDVALAARSFDRLAAQAAYGEDARTILNRALATHTSS
ncbi:DUF5753 domain-containing protein [Nocardia sp. NPDC004415]